MRNSLPATTTHDTPHAERSHPQPHSAQAGAAHMMYRHKLVRDLAFSIGAGGTSSTPLLSLSTNDGDATALWEALLARSLPWLAQVGCRKDDGDHGDGGDDEHGDDCGCGGDADDLMMIIMTTTVPTTVVVGSSGCVLPSA
jgi:hypothetical protein